METFLIIVLLLVIAALLFVSHAKMLLEWNKFKADVAALIDRIEALAKAHEAAKAVPVPTQAKTDTAPAVAAQSGIGSAKT